MEEKREMSENEKIEMTDFESYFDSSQLDSLEGDGISIHCINSSEFVVGRQTNFNGPVTIINCSNDFSSYSSPSKSHELEKIVIKDKILSESATKTIGKHAQKKTDENFVGSTVTKKWWLFMRDYFRIPIGIWIIFLVIFVGVVVCLGFALKLFKNKKGQEEIKPTCYWYNSTNNKFCFYSNYDGEGWRSFNEIHLQKPIRNIIISHTEDNTCFDLNYCIALVESFSNNDKTNHSFCHFFVGADGNFYENPSKHLMEISVVNQSIIVCFIGNFNRRLYPTYPQIKATKNFIRYGIENNLLTKDYVILAAHSIIHYEAESSLYKIIKKWPNFNSDVIWIEESTLGNSSASNSIKIYLKEDWKGTPATSFVEMKLPVPYVVLSHSVTSQCFDLKSCSPLIKNMQNYHFSKDFADIAYNFLVDSSGNIYEGRGWKNRNVHLSFVNGRNIDINFIGDFSANIKPTKNQFEGIKKLIKYGKENGKISQNYSLIAANATYNTLSPGKNVYEVIKNWPHFDPHPESDIKEFDDS